MLVDGEPSSLYAFAHPYGAIKDAIPHHLLVVNRHDPHQDIRVALLFVTKDRHG